MSPDDIFELRQLAYRYARAVDGCDVAGFQSVFTAAGRLRSYHPDAAEPFADLTGREQLAAVPDTMRRLYRRTMHFMTNHIITPEGDAATGELMCVAKHLLLETADGLSHDVFIRYFDRYEREGGAWRIADRQIRFQWSESHPVVPGAIGGNG